MKMGCAMRKTKPKQAKTPRSKYRVVATGPPMPPKPQHLAQPEANHREGFWAAIPLVTVPLGAAVAGIVFGLGLTGALACGAIGIGIVYLDLTGKGSGWLWGRKS